jgi:hypothetical protein
MSERPTIECVDCQTSFPQPSGPWGANAIRCLPCRKIARDNRGNATSDGPMRTISAAFHAQNTEHHERLAGLALHRATGIALDFSTMIVEAVNVLLDQGESAGDIRKRLNPNPFGKLKATDPRHQMDRPYRTLKDTIMEEFVG